MPGLASRDDLSPEAQATLKKVLDRFAAAEKLHRQYEDKWNVYYGLSRNWRRLQKSHAQARTPNDKDTVVEEFRRVFGEELFIPYVYCVIETNLPRILSTSPEVRVLPNDEEEKTQQAVRPVKRLFERDHETDQYEIKLQEATRSGLRYGLGVGKRHWRRKTRNGRQIVPRMLGMGRKVVEGQLVVYEGPSYEAVDIFDFFWDPAGHSIDTLGYLIHRTWRSMEYIKARVETGEWAELDLEAVQALGSSTKRGESWMGRMEASGLSDAEIKGNNLHEVWEYHDRDRVVTVLDRELVVQDDVNPHIHGDFPFQIYRPTLVEHEFVGQGEAEPIAHLQYELNTLRGQRRDAANLALNRGYFYQEGTLDPRRIVTGAGVFNPVFGDPKDIIQPMPFTDIPQSGVSEEEALKRDIELTTAVSEASIGSSGEGTATGTQLVQQAANLRVKQKAKNLHLEVLVPDTAQQHALYEQFITKASQTRTMRVESDETESGFEFLKVGPDEINANIEVAVVDGSTEPDDPRQKRAEATDLATALAPFAEVIDVSMLIKFILTQFGIEKAEEWIKQQTPEGDPAQMVSALGHFLVEHGVDPKLVGAAIQQVAAQAEVASNEGEESEAPEQSAPESAPERAGAAP